MFICTAPLATVPPQTTAHALHGASVAFRQDAAWRHQVQRPQQVGKREVTRGSLIGNLGGIKLRP
jgi:hypothetical protein